MNQPIYIKLNVDSATGRTRSSVLARIAQIDVMITSLMTTAMTAVTTGNIAEYEIDTGQTKNQVKYTSVSSVSNAIREYEKIRTMYSNMLVPKVTRLVDSKNFRPKR